MEYGTPFIFLYLNIKGSVLDSCLLILFIFDHPRHLPAATGANPSQYQYSPFHLSACISNASGFSTSDTPDVVENFHLKITGYDIPDVSSPLNGNEASKKYCKRFDILLHTPPFQSIHIVLSFINWNNGPGIPARSKHYVH